MKDYNRIIETQKNKIKEFVKSPYYKKPLTEAELSVLLEVPSEDRELFGFVIKELVSEGAVIYTKKNRISSPEKAGLFTGILRTNERGFGFVSCEDSPEDIYIPKKALNGAAHTDTVLVQLTGSLTGHPSGEIKKIIKRGRSFITGVFYKEKKGGYAIPLDRHFFKRIDISKKDTNGADDESLVVVKLTAYPDRKHIPAGKIIKILGNKNDKGADVLGVMAENDIAESFPQRVIEQAEKIPKTIAEEDIAGREDLREVLTVTIDGEDAKDLDDAVSCKKLENGNFELGVYIADVSHYVKQGSDLDKEALKRGTSVYLADRVIPMLPEALSNGICSLNQGKDRLALCCIMEIDPSGQVVNHRTVKGVINVSRRMTYTEVNDILTCAVGKAHEEIYGELMPMFFCMKELKDILFEKRRKRGSLDFDIAEARVILDSDGKPRDIVIRSRNTATAIIEEFMIAANETIAEEFLKLDVPFMYRSHETPDEEKYEMLKSAVGRMGYVLKGGRKNPLSLQKLLEAAKDKPEKKLIDMLTLRSMQQARYTENCLGHYGLASKYYCHFTSPIRRYPDLFIHRVISAYIEGKEPAFIKEKFGKNLSKKADLCSENERRAEAAERDSVEMKKAEYMADKVGETFDGIISGITSWGIYVELANTVTGMAAYKSFSDDVYVYDEETMSCMGERTHKVYNIGDRVRVVLERADADMRRIDFVFEDSYKKAEALPKPSKNRKQRRKKSSLKRRSSARRR